MREMIDVVLAGVLIWVACVLVVFPSLRWAAVRSVATLVVVSVLTVVYLAVLMSFFSMVLFGDRHF